MKKQYTQPELYIENVVVESGIALSTLEDNFGFGDVTFEEANEGEIIW